MSFNPISTNRPKKRILICVRGQCADSDEGRQLEKYLQQLIEQHGLDDPRHPQYTTCTITNCLGVCSGGPIMIVHPEGIKYHQLNRMALDRIFQEHILHNQPVDALIIYDPKITATS